MATEQIIERAVCRLLALKGYEATSYRDVAQESGFDRSHVQYYFPSKKLFAGCFYHRMLDESSAFLAKRGIFLNEDEPISFAYMVGQIDYAFLQMNDSMRKLTAEMLEYRSISSMFIEIEQEWTQRHSLFQINQTPSNSGFREFVFWNGGIFECLWDAATTGEKLDSGLITASFIEHSARDAGVSESAVASQLAQAVLPPEVIEEACESHWKRFTAK